MAKKVYTTDVGTKIKLDTGWDIEAASSYKIVAKLGAAAAVNLTATIVETTKLQHQKLVTTLSEAGDWQLQAHVELTAGDVYRGEIVTLTVYAPLT